VNQSNARRSSRVEYQIPVSISARDSAGNPIFEPSQTLNVSKHGAVLLCRQPLPEGSEVELATFLGMPPARARVVRLLRRNSEHQVWRMAAELTTPGNCWKLAAPPEDWERATQHLPRVAPTRPNVLVIDDDTDLGGLLEATLTREGFQVTLLADSRLLESALRQAKYSLVVSDLQMPHRNGVEVLRVLREQAPELAANFILTTGNLAAADHHSAELVGVRVLTKPFSLAKLAEAARKMLARVH